MIVHSREPLNAEPPLDRLRASFVTAADDFYIRSHGPVPAIDPESYRLRLEGRVREPLDLTLDDLRALAPGREIGSVLQCAGNRRADLQPVRQTSGDPWAPGAIGYARWSGIALAELLRAAGSDEDSPLHVAFHCADEIELEGERFRFSTSIPMPRALHADVLLAWAMNGHPLRPEHGFPLRVVVPGYAGVRSPKWLTRIVVQDTPSDGHMQQRDYKLLPPHVIAETVDWQQGITINEMPLNAAICEPAADARLPPGRLVLRGYAVASAREIARVDVSTDDGQHWIQADLQQDHRAPWSWTFWEKAVDLVKGEHKLVVRAWDSAGQTQPADPAQLWNFKGYLSAAWHRVRVVAN